MRIVIVDYGMGNIKSIESALRYLGVQDIVIGFEYEVLNNSDKIILPGVGSFGKAIVQIRSKKIDESLKTIVLNNRKPLLGICLGMQLLGNFSNEDGYNEGLGFVNASVEKFDKFKVKVPHVGFNQVIINSQQKLYQGFNSEVSDFYFTHSYRMKSEEEINACHCNYQDDFIASFECDNIAGTQYHPELSQRNGLKLLNNFVNIF